MSLFLQREDASYFQNSQVGLDASFSHLLAGLPRAGQQWWYPIWEAAVLPNHCNRRRQLLTAVKCYRDRSGDALASSLLPPLTQVIYLLTSPLTFLLSV